MGRLIRAGTGFEYYRHVRIPVDEPPPPTREVLEREMEYFVEPEEAFTRDKSSREPASPTCPPERQSSVESARSGGCETRKREAFTKD
jgi:hypothetical protein